MLIRRPTLIVLPGTGDANFHGVLEDYVSTRHEKRHKNRCSQELWETDEGVKGEHMMWLTSCSRDRVQHHHRIDETRTGEF